MKSKLKLFIPLIVTGMLSMYACKSTQDKANAKNEPASDTSMQTNMPKEYYMQFATAPQSLDAGKEISFSLTPKIKGSEGEAVPLETMHDYKIHLILVSNDLSFYQHLHPEYNADGSYTVKTMVKNGGKYVLFADYMPSGADDKIERFEITVTGNELEAKLYNKENLTATADGYTVNLEVESGKLVTGETNHIAAIISKNGKGINANDLETLMSSKGHMVIISADTKKYIHVHPEVEDNRLDLHADFETPGIYRAFFQFQTGGKIHLVDFVLQVAQGDNNKTIEHKEHHH